MNRSVTRLLCVGLTAFTAGCGQAPPAPSEAAAPAVKQHVSFTAVAEPAAGRFHFVTQPQAALGVITQDKNGDPNTVTAGALQLYSSNVAFASGGVGYPSGCLTSSPQVMFADVQVFSGFNEQLRNVYVKITSVSGGQTFCGAKASVGSFGTQLDPNAWLYLYAPLDNGNPASFSLNKRSLKWGLQLPDNGAFWFNGDLWAEIVPALPAFSDLTDGQIFHGNRINTSVQFAWTEDLSANGGPSPVPGQPPLPNGVGSEVTIWQCSAATEASAGTCGATPVFGPSVETGLAWKGRLDTGFWYQVSLRPAFTLPGLTTTTIGTQVITRSLKAVYP